MMLLSLQTTKSYGAKIRAGRLFKNWFRSQSRRGTKRCARVCGANVFASTLTAFTATSPRYVLFIVIRNQNHFFNQIAEKKFYSVSGDSTTARYNRNDATSGYERNINYEHVSLSCDICRDSTPRGAITLIRIVQCRQSSSEYPDYFFLASILATFRPLITQSCTRQLSCNVAKIRSSHFHRQRKR